MEAKKSLNNLYLYIIVSMIVITDILLISFLREKLNYEFPNVLFNDVVTILIAGLLGKSFAFKNGFPLWWHRNQRLSILFILGLAIILPNTLVYYYNENATAIAPWLNFSNFKEPILISLRAGLQEEVIYRLFIFSLIVSGVNKVVNSKRISLIIGIIVSAFIFGILHSGFYWAFISGLILAYICYSYGLFFAILIHFLADAVPFTLLYFM